jgi:hypothetical protein
MALGWTQPLTEMSTRNLFGEQRAAGAYGWQSQRHLWADCLENVWTSTSHNPMGLNGLLQWQLYLYFIFMWIGKTFRVLPTRSLRVKFVRAAHEPATTYYYYIIYIIYILYNFFCIWDSHGVQYKEYVILDETPCSSLKRPHFAAFFL